MSDLSGLVWFCGKTQTGKTVHAIRIAFEAKERSGFPVLVIDSQGAKNFKDWPRAADRPALYEAVYGSRRDCAFTPKDEADVEGVFRTVRKMGRVILLLDEASFWISKRRLPSDVSEAMRTWFHSGVLFLFTTQRIADIHGTALAIDSTIRVYRTLEGPDTDRLWEEKRVKLEEVKDLPVGAFLTIVNGAVVRGGDGCPRVSREGA